MTLTDITPDEFNELADLIKPCFLAYRSGRYAAKSNATLLDCPYDNHTIERRAWMRGYRVVREEQVTK